MFIFRWTWILRDSHHPIIDYWFCNFVHATRRTLHYLPAVFWNNMRFCGLILIGADCTRTRRLCFGAVRTQRDFPNSGSDGLFCPVGVSFFPPNKSERKHDLDFSSSEHDLLSYYTNWPNCWRAPAFLVGRATDQLHQCAFQQTQRLFSRKLTGTEMNTFRQSKRELTVH